MAANKKLTKLFTEIADSIREVDGSIGKMTASEFPANIRSLKEEKPAYDMNEAITFHDYDGTLLYSYRVEEIKGLKELPPLPHHDGLICQGWNWDYEDVIALRHPATIGANYITDDGKTRFYFIVDEVRPSIRLNFWQSYPKGVKLNWGDGTEETFEELSIRVTHEYSKGGLYVVTLEPEDFCTLQLSALGYGILGPTNDYLYYITRSGLKRVELGRNLQVSTGSDYDFYNPYVLETITIPAYLTQGTVRLYGAGLVKCIVVPKGSKIIQKTSYYGSDIPIISLPYGLETIDSSAFAYNAKLVYINIPQTVRYFKSACFRDCTALQKINIPSDTIEVGSNAVSTTKISSIDSLENVQIFGTQVFAGTWIKKVTFPKNLTHFPEYTYQINGDVQELYLPDGVLTIGTQSIATESLTVLRLSKSLREIASSAMSVSSLTSITFPPSMTLFKGTAIGRMSSMKFFDFTCCNQIPILESAAAFSGYPDDFEIRVPEDLYDQWITSTNWTTYADRIVAYPRTEYESENN